MNFWTQTVNSPFVTSQREMRLEARKTSHRQVLLSSCCYSQFWGAFRTLQTPRTSGRSRCSRTARGRFVSVFRCRAGRKGTGVCLLETSAEREPPLFNRAHSEQRAANTREGGGAFFDLLSGSLSHRLPKSDGPGKVNFWRITPHQHDLPAFCFCLLFLMMIIPEAAAV